MASARENPDVAGLHDHFQPAVLRAIDMAISAAHAAGRKISVCGELASDPGGVALLLGMGVDELSVSVSALGRVKHIVSRLSKTQMHDLVKRVLPMNDVRDIKAELTATMEQAGLGGLVRAGR
jgi:phosphotransferase system enzyme I (PtsP)